MPEAREELDDGDGAPVAVVSFRSDLLIIEDLQNPDWELEH